MSSATIIEAGDGEAYNLVGDDLTIKIPGRLTGNTFALAETYCAPGGGPPPHIHHREDEMFLVLEGTIKFTFNRGSFVGKAGTAVYLPKGIPHCFKNVGPTPARFLVIAAPAGFEAFVAECGCKISRVPSGTPVSPEVIQKLLGIAPKYGLELRPDHVAPDTLSGPGNGEALWVLGQLVTIKLGRKETNGSFSVAEVTSLPGGFVPPHRHVAMDELFYVCEGTYEFTVDGKSRLAGPGTTLYVPRGVAHGFANRTNTRTRMLDLHTPAGFEDFFRDCGTQCKDPATPPKMEAPDMAKMQALFARHGMELCA